jgi:hypothetical protein
MARLGAEHHQIMFWLTCIFAVLGATLLAVSIFDPSTTDDRTAMGCIGITFTALAIILLAVMTYDR